MVKRKEKHVRKIFWKCHIMQRRVLQLQATWQNSKQIGCQGGGILLIFWGQKIQENQYIQGVKAIDIHNPIPYARLYDLWPCNPQDSGPRLRNCYLEDFTPGWPKKKQVKTPYQTAGMSHASFCLTLSVYPWRSWLEGILDRLLYMKPKAFDIRDSWLFPTWAIIKCIFAWLPKSHNFRNVQSLGPTVFEAFWDPGNTPGQHFPSLF